MEYFYNLKKKIEEVQVEIVDLYEQLRESGDARQAALNAAKMSIPNMENAIIYRNFFEITSLKLDTQVRTILISITLIFRNML